MRNFANVSEFVAAVYASPEYISTLATSTPISAHVPVDFELQGCPINKTQLLEVISAFLTGRKPAIAAHSVCIECKQRGTVCVMVQGTPCLGPVTHAGCGAICPSYPARLLWLLRADGNAEHCGSGARMAGARRGAARHPAGLSHLQRHGGTVLQGERRPMATKTIRVDYLARVEGEGALDLRSATAASWRRS